MKKGNQDYFAVLGLSFVKVKGITDEIVEQRYQAAKQFIRLNKGMSEEDKEAEMQLIEDAFQALKTQDGRAYYENFVKNIRCRIRVQESSAALSKLAKKMNAEMREPFPKVERPPEYEMPKEGER